VVGETGNAEPVKGTVLVKEPGSGKFVPLLEGASIPVGSTVDATKGVVQITATVDGRTVVGKFSLGMFTFTQAKKPTSIPQILLVGGEAKFKKCPVRRTSGRITASPKPIRRLFASAKGRFTTRGKYAAATVRGTEWTVMDSCQGTLTTVKSGSVSVRDLVLKKTVIVKPRRSYLARPRPRR
jgi:hypothetical protein